MISEYPEVRIAFFLAVLALMFFIETYWPSRSWFDRRSDRVKYSIGLAIINNLVVRIFVAAPFILLTQWVADTGWGLSKVLGLSGLPEILATLVLFDFFDALKHRWFHRVGFMWRFHRVHHTDKSLDVFTALRYHPGELLISAFIKALWILFWGPSTLAFIIFEIVLNFASEFHHSNVHLGFADRFINKFLVTPHYHAIHHTINREKGDQNFTTIFSFWDRFMGTFACPETNKVNLERLGELQDQHLSIIKTLKSPLISPTDNGNERFKADRFTDQEQYLQRKYRLARESINSGRGLLLDVRERNECLKYGRLKEAISLNYSSANRDNLRDLIRQYSDKKFYVFCRAGVRAHKVVDRLVDMQAEAHSLGGFQDCVEHGLSPEDNLLPPEGLANANL